MLDQRAAASGVCLDDIHAASLQQYFALLGKWNARMNLTALSLSPPSAEAIDRLIIEPLAAAARISKGPRTWIDLGSGAGSPAIPMKIACPSLALTMVESRGRKAAFLTEAVRTLELQAATVQSVRFETLAEEGRAAALVTARAVRVDEAFLRTASAIVPPGGELLLFRGDVAASGLTGFIHRETIRLVPATGATLLRYERAG